MSKKKLDDLIKFTGIVSDDKLYSLYTNASLFLMPSMYEGFGLPPLEAMAKGVPVVTSNRGSLPEILEKAAYYYNPSIDTALINAINIVLTNKKLAHRV